MSTFAIIAGIAAILAIVVTGLVIAVCLAVAWVTDAVQGRSRQGTQDSARTTAPPPMDGRHQNAPMRFTR
jgi:hypothetical protein